MSAANLTAPWSGLSPAVWILVVARAVNRIGAFTLPFLGVVLTVEFGASLAQTGLILALFGAATIPSRLLGGQLADRLGRRRVVGLERNGGRRGDRPARPHFYPPLLEKSVLCTDALSASGEHPASQEPQTVAAPSERTNGDERWTRDWMHWRSSLAKTPPGAASCRASARWDSARSASSA